MKFSKAKCEYIIDRVEELRNVKGGYVTLSNAIMFIFEHMENDKRVYKDNMPFNCLEEPVDEIVCNIIKHIDKNWLSLIIKS